MLCFCVWLPTKLDAGVSRVCFVFDAVRPMHHAWLEMGPIETDVAYQKHPTSRLNCIASLSLNVQQLPLIND
jgi:hypothetical protein